MAAVHTTDALSCLTVRRVGLTDRRAQIATIRMGEGESMDSEILPSHSVDIYDASAWLGSQRPPDRDFRLP